MASDENQPATKRDVLKIVQEATDAVLQGVEKLLEKYATKDDVDRLETRVAKVETDVAYVKDQMDGLKADLSTTPSRRELEELKAKVSHHHPTS